MSERTIPALMLQRDLTIALGRRRLSDPLPGEAVVRVQWAGLCGSDLHVFRTGAWVEEWPATLGHEIYGTVEHVTGDGPLQVGAHVVADSRVACGACPDCLAGAVDRCTHVRFVGECRPGGFATHCVLPTRMLHVVPDSLRSPTAVLAEPLAVVLHALSHLRSEPETVAILGHGPVGALVQIELRRRFPQAQITVAEPAALRAQLAQALGATTCSTAADAPSGAFDTVIDAAGYRGSVVEAIRLARTRGQVLLLALGGGTAELTPSVLVEQSLSVVGSNAFVGELPDAVSLLAAESWRYEPVITDAIAFDELPAMVRTQLEQPDGVKVIVCP